MACWDARACSNAKIAEDGITLTSSRNEAVAIGSPVMRDGQHVFSVQILKADGYSPSAGAHIYIGVVDADDMGTTLSYYPFVHDIHRGRSTTSTSSQSVKEGNLQGRVNGSRIEVRVDMTKRKLSFCINGGEVLQLEEEERLPASVRPYVFMRYQGDIVKLLMPQAISEQIQRLTVPEGLLGVFSAAFPAGRLDRDEVVLFLKLLEPTITEEMIHRICAVLSNQVKAVPSHLRHEGEAIDCNMFLQWMFS
eukprot:TRINITY_DN112500_c0_g1_i1.p1 TRINITY_DN112500_c0_g1~~TRINITY_DN112500_c0_g1_i1.p1  ORF type:complete len:250 (-),score=30.47 TRINITY_DN112500_c0_g1_i1:56-805(-)